MYDTPYQDPPVLETEPAPVPTPPVPEPPLLETPPTPPPTRPEGRRSRTPNRPEEPSERGAAVALLVMVAVVSVIVVAMGLQWRSFSLNFRTLPPLPTYPISELLEPSNPPELPRASNGDGTVLEVLPRPEGGPLSLQDIYRKVSPSVVSIQTEQTTGYSEGTGVILSADGYLITNEHVIRGGARAEVTLADGRSFEALLVGSDVNTDLAILKVDAENLTPADFGESDAMVVGDPVAAIGNPLGSQLPGSSTMTDGILSAVNRDLDVNGSRMTLLQTTAALNSGNSGGALVNDRGQVIGITNMKLVDRGFSAPIEGLGFAIPTSVVKTVTDSLIKYGHVTGRPMLGITVRTASLDELAQAGIGHGLYVSMVSHGSDAKRQGVQKGDLILSADGQDLYSNDDLMGAKEDLDVGDGLDLLILREGETIKVTVKLVEQYELTTD